MCEAAARLTGFATLVSQSEHLFNKMDYFSQKLTPLVMDDFFPQSVAGYYSQVCDNDIFKNLYLPFKNFSVHGCYFLLNLYWPSYSFQDHIPDHDYYIISFHTEYIDINWLRTFANNHSNSKILVIFDGTFYLDKNSDFWPKNITFMRWISWGQQLNISIKQFDIANCPVKPTKKISSLSMRATDYKMFVTAYLIKHCRFDDMVISWHQHNFHPANKIYFYKGVEGHPRLTEAVLNDDFQNLKNITLQDYFSQSLNFPIANSNWHHSAYQDCAFNLTNESMSSDYVENFLHPGPYLTEKTWKPLLAGQAFIPVGQPNTVKMLESLGLSLDFGLDFSFDQTYGLSRIEEIYSVLDRVLELDVNQLTELLKPAAQHNLDHIRSGNFNKQCNLSNYTQLETLDKWLN